MSELDGPDLAMAVARVIGGDDIKLDDECNTVWRTLRSNDGTPFGWTSWRPDLGGVAAWELLEWVRRKNDVSQWTAKIGGTTTLPGDKVCTIVDGYDDEFDGEGETDAIALCRAVVALGANHE